MADTTALAKRKTVAPVTEPTRRLLRASRFFTSGSVREDLTLMRSLGFNAVRGYNVPL